MPSVKESNDVSGAFTAVVVEKAAVGIALFVASRREHNNRVIVNSVLPRPVI